MSRIHRSSFIIGTMSTFGPQALAAAFACPGRTTIDTGS